MKRKHLTEEERVLDGLRACGNGTWEECSKCPYQGLDSKLDKCWEKLCVDAVALLRRQASCVELLDDALDESALILGELTDEVAHLRRELDEVRAKERSEAPKKSYFSAEEVRHMSLAEVEIHREVIIHSMKKWHEGG